jgi:uncharacterized protein (DUF2249 family)
MTEEREIDARYLEPPEPFVRVMESLDLLDQGQCQALRVLLFREPLPLYKVLDQNGYRRETRQEDDGTWVIRILPRA